MSKAPLAFALSTIALGVGWLLTAKGVWGGVDWAWTVGLGMLGLLVFLFSGVDKVSVVAGPMFLIASVCSVFRQTGRLEANVEVPCLVIALGFCLLLAQAPFIPAPKWSAPPAPPA